MHNQSKFLLVYFAREPATWQEAFTDDQGNFAAAAPGLKIEFVVADPDPAKFAEQAKWADVIYVRGGKTVMLKDVLKNIPDFKGLIERKIYAGSSAGATVLAKHYYSTTDDVIREGLGILPIKVMPHYNESKQDKLEELKGTGQDLPIYTIREGEYKIIEK